MIIHDFGLRGLVVLRTPGDERIPLRGCSEDNNDRGRRQLRLELIKGPQ